MSDVRRDSDRADIARRPRFRRHRFVKVPFVLQDRDREIIRLVADYRVISSAEIIALLAGSRQGILRRLQCLFHAGYLDRPSQQRQLGNLKLIYSLGNLGARLLNATGGFQLRARRREQNRRVGALHLEHALMVSRFRATLTTGTLTRGSVRLERWTPESELRDRIVVRQNDRDVVIPVCPDAYFVLRIEELAVSSKVHVFLEADRSTMSVERFITKLCGYWHYWRSGAATERYGIRNFLVLTLTRSQQRAENLRRAAERVADRGLRMFLFGSEGEFDSEHVTDRIWRVPGTQTLHSLTE